MDDKGEKIVTLAREMLRSDMDSLRPAPPQSPITLKLLCLTTMLAALGGGGVTEWIEQARRPINRYERVELNALVFYIAQIKNINADTLRLELQQKLSVSSLDNLTEHEFQLARSFLQEKSL